MGPASDIAVLGEMASLFCSPSLTQPMAIVAFEPRRELCSQLPPLSDTTSVEPSELLRQPQFAGVVTPSQFLQALGQVPSQSPAEGIRNVDCSEFLWVLSPQTELKLMSPHLFSLLHQGSLALGVHCHRA